MWKTAAQKAKFVPSVVAIAVVTVWPASWFGVVEGYSGKGYAAFVYQSTIGFRPHWPSGVPCYFDYRPTTDGMSVSTFMGRLAAEKEAKGRWLIRLPIPLFLIGLLPLAVGPFINFRYRVWQFIVWNSLVAAAIAYYFG